MSVSDLTGTKWVFDNTILPSSSSFVSYTITGEITSMQLGYGINSINIPLDSSYYSGENILSMASGFRCVIQTSNGGWQLFDWDSEYAVEDFGNSMEIEITGGTDATNSTLIQWLETNATQIVEPSANTYELTHNLTNVSKGNTTFVITPDTGYELPSSVSVSNGTLVSYDSTTGEVVVSGDNAIISAECVASAPSGYTVTVTDTASIDNSVIVDIYDGADTTGTLLYSSYDATTPISLTISSGYIFICLSASGSISNISTTGGVSYVGYVGDGIYYSVVNDGTISIRTDD